jgi:hypothetical protein
MVRWLSSCDTIGSRPVIPLENARCGQVSCSEVLERSGFRYLFQHHYKAWTLKVCYLLSVIAWFTIFRAYGTQNGKPCYYYSNFQSTFSKYFLVFQLACDFIDFTVESFFATFIELYPLVQCID